MFILRDVIETIKIFFIALFISIIIYPLLHELGHSVIAILIGKKILEIRLFPLPNIMYISNSTGYIENLLIGFGGMLLPIIVSMNIRTKRFWIWYSNFILKSICLLSLIISTLAIIFHKRRVFLQDDMRIVLGLGDLGKILCLIIIICMGIILSLNIYREIHKITT